MRIMDDLTGFDDEWFKDTLRSLEKPNEGFSDRFPDFERMLDELNKEGFKELCELLDDLGVPEL